MVAMETVRPADAHIRALFAVAKGNVTHAASEAFEMKGQAELLDEHGRSLAQYLRAARALLVQADCCGRLDVAVGAAEMTTNGRRGVVVVERWLLVMVVVH